MNIDQKKLFNDALQYADISEAITVLLWNFFRKQKMRFFLDLIYQGMSWHYAFIHAKYYIK